MSFVRVVVTAGLTSLALGAVARGWSFMRHGPSSTTPPSDCPPRGARIAGLRVARREIGFVRSAPMLVLLHHRGADGEQMIDVVGGLAGPVILLAPTGPMPVDRGAAWMWTHPEDAAFGSVVRSAAGPVIAFLREVRRCNPGRRLIAVGQGQGAHVLLTAAALEPTLTDQLLLVGGTLPDDLVPAALPRTLMLHATGDVAVPVAEASELAVALGSLGLPVEVRELDGDGELAGPLLAGLLASLEAALIP